MKRTGNPPGRPSKFRLEVASRVIARMCEGQGINPACRAEGVDPRTFRGHCEANLGGDLWGRFARAQAILALMREDEAFSIADAGGRYAARQIKWRLNFAERWTPRHLRPR
jgi:hypothetical protein